MSAQHASDQNDEFIWLEDIYGERPLAWVTDQNARTLDMLATPTFDRTERSILEVLDSDARIPMVTKHGDSYYNFWKDADHPRGLWRRTTLASYRTDDPVWESCWTSMSSVSARKRGGFGPAPTCSTLTTP